MTLSEIKRKLGIENLQLNTSKDAQGTPTNWYRMWDNSARVQISIHKDTANALKTNPNMTNLEIQIEDRISETSGKAYTNKRIIAYTEVAPELVL